MTDYLDGNDQAATDKQANEWQLTALTAALGDLTVTVNDSLSVGRGSDNDVVLGSKEVSRNHALLSVLNGQLYVKDLSSSNGTFVNDIRIEGNKSKSLKSDDTLGFASFNFKVMTPTTATKDIEQPVLSDNVTDPASTTTAPVEPVVAPTTEPTAVDTAATDVHAAVDSQSLNSESVDSKATVERLTTTEPEVGLDTGIDKVVGATAATIDSPIEPVVVDKTVIEKTVIDDVVLDEIVLDEIVLEQKVAPNQDVALDATDKSVVKNTGVDNQPKNTNEPVVKETMIAEVLSATDSAKDAPVTTTTSAMPTTLTEQEIGMSDNKSKDLLVEEPVIKDPIVDAPVITESNSIADTPVTDEPLMQAKAAHQEPVVSPEHDKTTTTALQEEADPDVLRAKQAATGQFSGTANLGAGRDLGTQGNNAMDQAIDNPANAEHSDKKPSGSWFIWVFLAIIIIGIALWLFNMGGA